VKLQQIINTKILKDVRNRVNRLMNCDNANMDKTVMAAQKQIDDIRFLIDSMGEEVLPEHLLTLAKIRLENPESSLSDLGAMLDPPLSRSGVNHRLKKISEIAANYKK
jgi:DNA-binding protein WhiA